MSKTKRNHLFFLQYWALRVYVCVSDFKQNVIILLREFQNKNSNLKASRERYDGAEEEKTERPQNV